MKKLLAIAFIGGLVFTSCEKKETTNDMDTVVAEPVVTDTTMADSTMMDSTTVVAPVVTDSTMTK